MATSSFSVTLVRIVGFDGQVQVAQRLTVPSDGASYGARTLLPCLVLSAIPDKNAGGPRLKTSTLRPLDRHEGDQALAQGLFVRRLFW
jgi:hypothetical protein